MAFLSVPCSVSITVNILTLTVSRKPVHRTAAGTPAPRADSGGCMSPPDECDVSCNVVTSPEGPVPSSACPVCPWPGGDGDVSDAAASLPLC